MCSDVCYHRRRNNGYSSIVSGRDYCSVVLRHILSMQPVYCECPDRYWEFVCGKGDVVEASFDTVSSLCVFNV